jgi:hypothetical protein
MLTEIIPAAIIWLAGFAVGYVVREMVRLRKTPARRPTWPPML